MAEELINTPQPPVATEVDCIEVNKVFDECLAKKCIPDITIPGIGVGNKTIVGASCSNFEFTVPNNGISQVPIPNEPGFSKFTVKFDGKFDLTIQLSDGSTIEKKNNNIPQQTVSNVKLYCPEPIAYIITQTGTGNPEHLPNETIKLEFIGECVDVSFVNPQGNNIDAVVTVGIYLIIKCEQVVQIQVLGRGYCVAPECTSPTTNPCEEFLKKPVPSFFPAQMLPF